ncbi:MAG: hypothetical protein AB1715_01315 [Acidobacteriota bacterium]
MSKKSAALIFLVLASVSNLHSQKLSLHAGTGIFRPAGNAVRSLYGNSIPLVLDVGYRLGRKFGLAAGLEWRRDRGVALPIGPGTEEFPVRLRMVSVPVSAFAEFSGELGRFPFVIDLGAGISWNSYKETWDRVALSHSGTDWGYRLYATADFRPFPRIGFFAQVRWDTVPTGRESILDENINLGGVGLLAGLSLYLF